MENREGFGLTMRGHSSDILKQLQCLGVDPGVIVSRNLPSFQETNNLVVADVSRSGRKHMLVAATADAWQSMKSKAHADGISLIVVSAFRSVERQFELLRRRLEQGISVESIFASSAPPGYSEHHTGRAIDIGTADCPPLAQEFEDTAAFSWLLENANEFDFELSYPRGNEFGFCYEPWHWCHHLKTA